MEKNLIESEYRAFVTEIKAKVYQSQHQALRQANTFLINLYWEIGKSIVEKQERHGWGKSVVEKLAGAITLSLWKSAKMPGRDNSI